MSTPLLLIHGMCCTGEVWSNYRTFFEARGREVFTPTLRPELRVRRNPPKAGLGKLRFSDYVQELEAEVAKIEARTGQAPDVIGHSMGGLLGQALAQGGKVQKLVAISPAPLARVSPLKNSFVTGLAGFGIATGMGPKAILPPLWAASRDVFNCVTEDDRLSHWKAMVHESLSVFADFRHADVDPAKITCPTLIVGCKRDRLVLAAWTRKTAEAYPEGNGEYVEYAEHGHWIYAEPDWEKPVGEIAAWFESN